MSSAEPPDCVLVSLFVPGATHEARLRGPLKVAVSAQKAFRLRSKRERLFELTLCPSRALNSSHGLLSELQRDEYTFRSSALGAEVSGHHSEKLMQTMILHLLKTHLFSSVKKGGLSLLGPP